MKSTLDKRISEEKKNTTNRNRIKSSFSLCSHFNERHREGALH